MENQNVKTCKICSNKIIGRSDKVFCTTKCKNYYHINLRKVTLSATQKIDEILHRNRSILLEVMGKRKTKNKIHSKTLDAKNFKYKYHTHTHVNKEGKTMHWVYDFGWMQFSDDQILIIRNNKSSH